MNPILRLSLGGLLSAALGTAWGQAPPDGRNLRNQQMKFFTQAAHFNQRCISDHANDPNLTPLPAEQKFGIQFYDGLKELRPSLEALFFMQVNNPRPPKPKEDPELNALLRQFQMSRVIVRQRQDKQGRPVTETLTCHPSFPFNMGHWENAVHQARELQFAVVNEAPSKQKKLNDNRHRWDSEREFSEGSDSTFGDYLRRSHSSK